MAGMIYTPVTLWEGFRPELPIREEKSEEYEKDGIVFSKIRFGGRSTETGRVSIFALTAYDRRNAKMPGLLILPSYGKRPDERTVAYFAKQGYFAMMADYAGRRGGDADYTGIPRGRGVRKFHGGRDSYTAWKRTRSTPAGMSGALWRSTPRTI